MVEAHPDARPPSSGFRLVEASRLAGWPEDLAERLLRAGCAERDVVEWAGTGSPNMGVLTKWVSGQELLRGQSLTVRIATWDDAEILSTLAADSPEQVGEWTVTTERSPNPFAQLAMQDEAYAVVLEDLGFGLGMVFRSTRDTFVGGTRTTLHTASSARIRTGFRGMGLSSLLMQGAGPAMSRRGAWSCWYVRDSNVDSGWTARFQDPSNNPDFTRQDPVMTLTDPVEGLTSERARPATRSDLETCCEMIARANAGSDFFLPPSVERMERRLADRHSPEGASVYGWDDFWVIADGTKPVACAGLWDRGRDIRDRWHHPASGQTAVDNPTAIVDFGYSAGRENDAQELIGHLLSRSGALGRSGMLLAINGNTGTRSIISEFSHRREPRSLHWTPPPGWPGPANGNMHTDLGYF